MRAEARRVRQEQIEQAAYALLEERGYGGVSMLAIARAARASNETLYRWYGDKQGLFRALVARNTERVRELLDDGRHRSDDPLDTLSQLGPALVELLTGPRAIALNRAAAADPTLELGAAIAHAGRDTILPLIGEVLEQARERGQLRFSSTDEAQGLYLDLLIGDLQIRRAIGRIPPPTPQDYRLRAQRAQRYLVLLLSPDGAPNPPPSASGLGRSTEGS